MKRRFFIYFIFLVVLTGTILIFFRTQKKNNSPNPSVKNREYVDQSFRLVNSLSFTESPYRLLPAGDSLIVCTDTSVFLLSKNLKTIYSINLPAQKKNGFFYVYTKDSLTASINAPENILFVKDKGKQYSKSGNGFLTNGVLTGNSFFYLGISLGKDMKMNIEKWDYILSNQETKLDLINYIKPEIKHCTMCLENTLEGNFFRINDNSFGYYFYRGGYFIVYKDGKFVLKKTLIDYPFIAYTEREANLGGMRALQCQAEKDIYVQMSACSFEKNIYILSNIIDKKYNTRCIDIYNSDNLLYSHTLNVPNYKQKLPTDILMVSKNNIIVLYETGQLVSYELK